MDQQNNNLNHHTQHNAGTAYYVVGYLEQAFPIHAQKLVEIDGNMVAEPLRDETGALVVSREALGLRDAAMMELMTLAPIPSALDQILWAFGDEAVAEVTGRSIRPLPVGGRIVSQGRDDLFFLHFTKRCDHFCGDDGI